MESDLKKENSRSIYCIMVASLAASAFFQFGGPSASNLIELAIAGSGSLVISAVLVMVANLLPQAIKHKLIFTRFKNELPGGRVDRLCKNDPRLEYGLIENRWPEVFANGIDSATRNSRWYQQIYKPVKDVAEVLQAHRSFLLYRDTFTGLLLILVATAFWSLIGDLAHIGQIKPSVFMVQGALVIASLVAARIAGNRFVVNAVSAAD